MKYEIGQKVETPLGIGEVIDVFTREDKTISECKVCIKTHSVWFRVDDIKPYKSAHDRLIEMGYNVQQTTVLNSSMFTIYGIDGASITIIERKGGSTYKTKQEVSLELSRILTQYLEEMAE